MSGHDAIAKQGITAECEAVRCFAARDPTLRRAIAAAIAMYGPQGVVWTASQPAQVTAAEQERADCMSDTATVSA